MEKKGIDKKKVFVIVLIVLLIAVVVAIIVIANNKNGNKQSKPITNTVNTVVNEQNATTNSITNTTTNTVTNTVANTQTNTQANAQATNTAASQQQTQTQSQSEQQEISTATSNTAKLYVGTAGNYSTYDVEIVGSNPTTDKAESIINEISYKLGYRIYIKEVYSGKGGMTVDLSADSAPFDLTNTYKGNGEEAYRTYSAEDTTKAIFSSINKSLKSYFGESMDIYFSKDGSDISANGVNIKSTEPYKD